MADELPELRIPTGAQPLLKLKWTARAHDPSETRAPPTDQEMAEWIASDKWEKFSDASSDGSAYDEIELDAEANKPGWTRPKYPIPPGYKGEEVSDRPQGAELRQGEDTADGKEPTGGDGPSEEKGTANRVDCSAADAGIEQGEGETQE